MGDLPKITDRRSSALGGLIVPTSAQTSATIRGQRLPMDGISMPAPGFAGRTRGIGSDDVLQEMRRNRAMNRRTQRVGRLSRTAATVGGNSGSFGGGANVQFATGRPRDPMFYWRQNNIPYDVTKDDELKKIRAFCRLLYLTHPIVAACIDIYSKFPLQGMSFECKDEQLIEFYGSLFIDELGYEDYLVDVGREYWLTGEAWPLGSWNEQLGVWDGDELLQPDDVEVERSPFLKDPRYLIRLPQTLRKVLQERSPRWEYDALMKSYPELAAYAGENALMPVSNILLQQLKFKGDTFHKRGLPILMRGFRAIVQEEMLNAAMDAVADRLYTPLILAKLGASATDLGTEAPWIPTSSDLEDFEEAVDASLAADFRLLVHHFAITMEPVFGRENMPDMTADFERIEDRILQVFGLSRTILQGASSGETYAADALNRDVVTQLLSVPCGMRTPILQSWRGGPVLRTMEQVWKQAEAWRPVEDDGWQQMIELPVDNNPTYTLCFHRGMGNWGKIKRIIRHWYDGPIVHLQQKWGEVQVTPNHSVYAASGDLVEPRTNPEMLAIRTLNQKFGPDGESVSLKVPHARKEPDGWARRLHKNGKLVSYPGAPRKLSSKNIQTIHEMLADERPRKEIADKFSVSVSRVGQIARGQVGWDWEQELRTGEVRVAAHERAGRSRLKVDLKGADLDDFLMFLGAWIAEGSAHVTETGAGTVDISQADRTWLESIQQHVHSFVGEESSSWISQGVVPAEGHRQIWNLVVSNRTLCDWLHHNAGVGAHNKRLPDFVFGLAWNHVQVLLNAMIDGDGTISEAGNWYYHTSSEELAQGVGLLCLLHGFHFTVNIDDRTGVYTIRTCRYYESRSDEVRRIKEIPYSGWVYDFEMDDSAVPNFTVGVGQPVVHNTHYQRQLRQFYDRRAYIVAEAQEHYDYEVRNGKRYVKMEEILEVDEESGEEQIVQQPKLLIPTLTFDTMTLQDEQQERQFIEALCAAGVPISYKRRLLGTGIDFDEEMEALTSERAQLALQEQEARRNSFTTLRDANLPIPSDLADDFQPKAAQAAQKATTQPGSDLPIPSLGQQPMPLPALSPTPADLANAESDPNAPVDPTMGQLMPMQSVPQPGDQRPPESDEQRGGMPKPAVNLRRVQGEHIPGTIKKGIREATQENFVPVDNSGENQERPQDFRPTGKFGNPRTYGMRRHVKIKDSAQWDPEWNREVS